MNVEKRGLKGIYKRNPDESSGLNFMKDMSSSALDSFDTTLFEMLVLLLNVHGETAFTVKVRGKWKKKQIYKYRRDRSRDGLDRLYLAFQAQSVTE